MLVLYPVAAFSVCVLFASTLFIGMLGSAHALDSMEMADRVFVDRDVGISFRYPYSYHLQNPYGHTINGRIRGTAVSHHSQQQVRIEYFTRLKSQEGSLATTHDMIVDNKESAHVNVVGAENTLGAVHTTKPLSTVIRSFTDVPLTRIVDYTFYSDKNHYPHRHTDWAPEHVKACVAHTKKGIVFLVEHGQHYSGLRVQGLDGDAALAEKIIQSFQIMKKHPENENYETWNEFQTRRGRYILSPGNAQKVKAIKRPSSWKQAYELETRYFHITTTCTPKYVKYWLEHLEKTHEALSLWMQSKRPVNLKYEVHVTKTRKEFTQIGDYLYGDMNKMFQVQKKSGALGGFFNPMTRALYTFTDKIRHSKMSNRVRLGHEFVHQYMFIHSSYNWSLPGWLNEGLAVFFENGFVDGDVRRLIAPRTRLKLLKYHYENREGLIGDLRYYLRGGGVGNVHQYAETYAIIHQLLNETGGQERFRQYWAQYRDGANGVQLFKDIFTSTKLLSGDYEQDVEEWTKSIIRHVKSGRARKVMTYKESEPSN